jgi:N-acetylmuramoyl-L-alanine amidase
MENLKIGSSGEDVERLQERLKEFGFYKGKITGEFNEKTEDSVKSFQDAEGLAVDGFAGLMTLHELDLLKPESTDKEI